MRVNQWNGGRHQINEKFFDDLNSYEKLRMLGFLFADGCNNYPSSIIIRLSSKRRSMLESILNSMESDYSIKDYLVDNKYPSSSITIKSKYLSSRLNDLGMIKAKSLSLKYPDWLDDWMVRPFISGYWDGDGMLSTSIRTKSISGKKYSYPSISFGFCGNSEFIRSTKKILENEINIKFSESFRGNILHIRSSSRKNFPKFYNYIKPETNFYDPVKMEKANIAMERK